MFNTHHLIGSSLLVLFLFVTALAQEKRGPIDNPGEPVAPIATGPLVTAAATAGRVRFVSPGTAVQLRLEVYNEAGQKLFDTELRGGNVLDWHLQDGAGQRLPPGAYACVLTSKSLSGRLSQRVGLVRVNDQEAVVEAAGVAQLSMAQQQAVSSGIASGVSPLEGKAAFAVLKENETEAITAVTHDGQVGQVTSTAGALTFRTGDLFAGKEVERVRITAAGNVGIGTDNPAATLDVAGAIRTQGGIRFDDGTLLRSASNSAESRTDANGDPIPSAAGTGTINSLAKWSETGGAGTLTDSALFEAGGQLGVGTTSPNPNAVVHADRSQNTSTAMFVTNNNPGTGAIASIRAGLDPANLGANYASLNILGANWPAGAGGVLLKGKTVLIEGAGSNLAIGNISPSEPIQFYTTASRLERMRITSGGDVGIGTTNPTAKLDVTGNINTSTQYNIDGNRILSNAGHGNLFAGREAGNSNTGSFNSFFGALSGVANTTGNANSFFGNTAGSANTTGDDNSFFGVHAGSSNSTGFSNSFFGQTAGNANSTGFANAFFGATAGSSNTEGGVNSFFGFAAGGSNSTGDFNSFFGVSAGFSNTTADANSFFGALAGNSNTIGSNNSFFGFDAGGSTSLGGRNVFVGYEAGRFNNVGSRNSYLGAEAGMNNNGQDNVFVGDKAGMLNTQGILNTFIGAGAVENGTTGDNNTALGADTVIIDGHSFVTVIGAGADSSFSGDNTVILGRGQDEVYVPGTLFVGTRRVPVGGDIHRMTVTGDGEFYGTLKVGTLGTVGVEELCRNVNTDKIAPCSSSLRYKTAILPFSSGLNLVNRLRPISFTWKEAGRRDLGLGAEDVEKVEPLLVTYNDKGEVEGVKYDRVAVVLLNAVKEQQVLITKQEQQLRQQQKASLEQQRQLDALRRLVCRNNPRARVCR